MSISYLLLLPFFLPPSEWSAAQPKELSPYVKVGFVGKGSSNFHPSINLSSEKTVRCTLPEYIKSVKAIHLSQPGTSWRDLGPLKMKAGTGRLIEVRTADRVLLQAIYLADEMAYILTSAVSIKDFLSMQQEILASFKSFDLVNDLWSLLKEAKIRDQILSLIEAKEWKNLRQLIEKETSSMGKYWQFLALQEAYGKMYPNQP
jgi:hypothetical protein